MSAASVATSVPLYAAARVPEIAATSAASVAASVPVVPVTAAGLNETESPATAVPVLAPSPDNVQACSERARYN